MKNLIVTFLIIASLSSLTFAENPKKDSLETQMKSEKIESSSKRTETASANDSDSYYKLLFENTKETNSKLLSLLTTSLSVIIAVIIAIIGSSIFYNYRFNKKEYELLTKETSNRIEEIQNRILEKTKEEIEKLTVQNRREISKQFHQLSETYKTNYDTIKDSLKTIITSFKQDIDNNLENSSERIKSIQKKVEQIEKSAEKELDFKEKRLKIDILNLKGEIYLMKNWYGLALSNFIEEALLCVETNNSWRLEYVAIDIIGAMDETIRTSQTITPSGKINLEKVLPEFPSYAADKKKEIEEKLKNVIIKEVELPNRSIGEGLFGSIIN